MLIFSSHLLMQNKMFKNNRYLFKYKLHQKYHNHQNNKKKKIVENDISEKNKSSVKNEAKIEEQ